MSRCASALGASGLSLLPTSWAGDLKMLAPFLFFGAERMRMKLLFGFLGGILLFSAFGALMLEIFVPNWKFGWSIVLAVTWVLFYIITKNIIKK